MDGNDQTEHDPNCMFCQWLRTRRQVETLGTVVAFNDGYPVTDGHMLIVPRRHTKDWFSMNEAEIRDSDALIHKLVEKIRQQDPAVTGFNIGMNVGASAGQTVFHAHTHLIPRRNGDTANPKGGVRGVIDGKRGY